MAGLVPAISMRIAGPDPTSRQHAPSPGKIARISTGMRPASRHLKPDAANVWRPINSVGTLTRRYENGTAGGSVVRNVTRKVRPNVRYYPQRRCSTEPTVTSEH